MRIKVLSLLVVIVMVFSLASCQGGQPAEKVEDNTIAGESGKTDTAGESKTTGRADTLEDSDDEYGSGVFGDADETEFPDEARQDELSRPGEADDDWGGDAGESQAPGDDTEEGDVTPADSFLAYTDIKDELLFLVSDALRSRDETISEVEGLYFLFGASDAMMFPVEYLGFGFDALADGLEEWDIKEIEYIAKDNEYIVKFSDFTDTMVEYRVVYNPNKDSLVCDITSEGGDVIRYEYCRTDYGYVGQVYMYDGNERTTDIIRVAVDADGKDGVIGISHSGSMPRPLTGSEPEDFPKECQAWYMVEGTHFTCVTSKGDKYEFDF